MSGTRIDYDSIAQRYSLPLPPERPELEKDLKLLTTEELVAYIAAMTKYSSALKWYADAKKYFNRRQKIGLKACCDNTEIPSWNRAKNKARWEHAQFIQEHDSQIARSAVLKLNTDMVISQELWNSMLTGLSVESQRVAARDGKYDPRLAAIPMGRFDATTGALQCEYYKESHPTEFSDFFNKIIYSDALMIGNHMREYISAKTSGDTTNKGEYYTFESKLIEPLLAFNPFTKAWESTSDKLSTVIASCKRAIFKIDSKAGRFEPYAVGINIHPNEKGISYINFAIKFQFKQNDGSNVITTRFHTGEHKQREIILNIHMCRALGHVAYPFPDKICKSFEQMRELLAERLHQFYSELCKNGHWYTVDLMGISFDDEGKFKVKEGIAYTREGMIWNERPPSPAATSGLSAGATSAASASITAGSESIGTRVLPSAAGAGDLTTREPMSKDAISGHIRSRPVWESETAASVEASVRADTMREAVVAARLLSLATTNSEPNVTQRASASERPPHP